MDLLFKRYASPYSFMDGMILTGRFEEFVIEFISTVSKEKEEEVEWEFFLHKIWNASFKEFKEMQEINNANLNMSEDNIETTIKHSMKILNNFNPDERGE